MLKKGFTLVELLAVIVILAVIALITTPIITGILRDSQKEAFKDSVSSLIKVTQNYYAGITYNDEGLLPVKITYNNKTPTAKGIDKNNTCKAISKNILDYSGENPDSGSILITKEGKVSFALYNKNLNTCVQKGENDKTAEFVDKPESECKITQNAC